MFETAIFYVPLSLAIGHVKADSGPIQISTWTETDFRTGLAPWWK